MDAQAGAHGRDGGGGCHGNKDPGGKPITPNTDKHVRCREHLVARVSSEHCHEIAASYDWPL